jgi:hypothetical protein
MAAHVFDTAEPSFDTAREPKVRNNEPITSAAGRDAPMFAAQPAVFERMHQRQRVGAGPLIGLAVGAIAVGGLVFALSRHHQVDHGGTAGIHATSQPAAMVQAAAPPVIAPATPAIRPAPMKTVTARPAPDHLRIVTAPSRPAPVARRVARPIVRTRPAVTSAQPAPAAAPETVINPPAPMAITPQPTPPAPSVAPSPVTPAPTTPAPSMATPAPTPAPMTPDGSGGGQATPQ